MARSLALLVVHGVLSQVRMSLADSGPTAELVECLQGTGALVLTQASDATGFNTSIQIWNERFQRQPTAVVYANSSDEVQQVVKCCRANNVQVRPRSGGHSYEGYSVEDGAVLLDISQMDSLAVQEDGLAVIGAGIKLGPMYLGLWQNGQRAFPAGVCPGVGAGGHLSGGGVGMLGRMFGLASDQIVALDIVDANGNLITADENNNPDLLFASQGGGGGNLGIITSFTVKTYAAPADATFFSINWDLSNTVPVVDWWQRNAPFLPWELSTDVLVSTGYAQMSGMYLGTQDGLMAVLDAAGFISLPAPQSQQFEQMDYIHAALNNAVLSQGLKPADDINSLGLGPGTSLSERSYFKAKSQVANEPIALEGLQQIQDSLGSSQASGYWQAHAEQGAIATIPNNATAYSHRDAIMIVQLMATWSDPSQQASAEGWLDALYNSTLPYVAADEAYVNYVDADQADWAQAYYGSNLPRLQQIKSTYDPDNFWQSPQGIPPLPQIATAAQD